MHPLIRERRAAMIALCHRFGVRRLEVFGSAARGDDFDPERSDVDLLVEFNPDREPVPLAVFFELREALTDVVGRRVDLVMAGSIHNPYIDADMQRSRESLYAS